VDIIYIFTIYRSILLYMFIVCIHVLVLYLHMLLCLQYRLIICMYMFILFTYMYMYVYIYREQETAKGQLEAQQRQLGAMGQSLRRERDTNNRQLSGLTDKIRRKHGEKKKLSLTLNQLNMAREEEEPEEDIGTYVSNQALAITSPRSYTISL